MKRQSSTAVFGKTAPGPRPTLWAALLLACLLSVPFALAALVSLVV
ncbi:hypothetical protein [Litorivita pollutaquae]|nr:hypothetical protein [Litorivita pollutaquae]